MPERSKTRNSPLRKFSEEIWGLVAAGIYDNASWAANPNLITFLGAAGVAGSARYAYVLNRTAVEDSLPQRLAAGVVLTGFLLTDGLDGAMERFLQSIDSKRLPSRLGAHFDFISDRFQEGALAVARAASAYERGDKIGELLAYGALITNPLPSGARALVESLDRVVPENGHNLLEASGTRVGKAGLGAIGLLLPEVRAVPIRNMTDTIQIIGNIAGTLGRGKVLLNGEKAGLTPEERRAATERLLIAAGTEIVSYQAFKVTRNSLRAKASKSRA